MSPEHVTLYYREGGSDKVYQAAIEAKDDGFIVTFAFGRRGSTLQTGAKTAQPVPYEQARKIYDKLVVSKTAKGYTPGEDGTPYQQTDLQQRSTGILPQLLNAIDEAEVQRLIDDPAWLAQEKLDGKRVLILCTDGEIIGINRKGLSIALPQPIIQQAKTLNTRQWVMDGEAIGGVFFTFDLLEIDSANLRVEPYHKRLKELASLVGAGGDTLRVVESARTKKQKTALLARLKQSKREGIVLKRHDAPYVPGRPASGGSQVKCKFYATASCIVAAINSGKRSVALELYDPDNGSRIAIGNVTIPANQPVPAAGDVVDVKYLYYFSGGSLYQPVYLGRRQDLAGVDCRIDQLKLRPAGEEEEA